MKITLNIKELLPGIGVFFMLFLAFNRSLNRALFGGNKGAVLIMLAALGMLVMYRFISERLYLNKYIIKWLLFLFIALINNYDVKRGDTLSVVQLVVGICAVMILSSHNNWCSTFVNIVKILTIVHLIFGVILLFNRQFLIKNIVPLFHLETSDSYYLTQLRMQIDFGYMTGLTSHYSTMGMIISIGLLFASGGLYVYHKRLYLKDAIILLAMSIGILLTGKRSALLFPLLSIATVYLSFFLPKNLYKKSKRILFFVISILIIFIIANLNSSLTVSLNRLSNIFGTNNMNQITNTRYEMLWLPAILMFLENPLLGIGWGNFKYSFTDYYTMTTNRVNNVHNVYIQLLCETGVIGTTLILSILLSNLFNVISYLLKIKHKKIIATDKQTSLLGISLTIQIYFFLYAITGNPLYDIPIFFPYLLACTMGYSVAKSLYVFKNNDYRENEK